MSTRSPLLNFRSSNFAVEPGEDENTNPGLFGRALAAWLGRELVPSFDESGIVAEDFGWLVAVPHPKHSLYIACVSADDSTTEWRVFVFAEGGLLARMLGRLNLADAVDALYARVKALLLATPGIADVEEERA